MRRSKYHAKKCTYKDMTFDSVKEANRYRELELMERAGIIKNLERQKVYELIPSQRDADGKVLERAVRYIADFVYEEDGYPVVEDCKGMRTDTYILKRKLMLWKYGIKIKET